jgi:hypothetical protein
LKLRLREPLRRSHQRGGGGLDLDRGDLEAIELSEAQLGEAHGPRAVLDRDLLGFRAVSTPGHQTEGPADVALFSAVVGQQHQRSRELQQLLELVRGDAFGLGRLGALDRFARRRN